MTSNMARFSCCFFFILGPSPSCEKQCLSNESTVPTAPSVSAVTSADVPGKLTYFVIAQCTMSEHSDNFVQDYYLLLQLLISL